MDPDRTSPTAKTPGAEVSNGSGSLSTKSGWSSASSGKEAIGQHKPFLVEPDGTLEPRCGGFRPDEAKSATHFLRSAVSRRRVLKDDGFKVAVALECSDLGIGQDLDIWIGCDAINE